MYFQPKLTRDLGESPVYHRASVAWKVTAYMRLPGDYKFSTEVSEKRKRQKLELLLQSFHFSTLFFSLATDIDEFVNNEISSNDNQYCHSVEHYSKP